MSSCCLVNPGQLFKRLAECTRGTKFSMRLKSLTARAQFFHVTVETTQNIVEIPTVKELGSDRPSSGQDL